ncbi:MAG TPA: thymidine phosphorylase [Candidatus Sulfotelmatobacter sp.]|nr:thymidine phosphorylase [Terriglobales bacterium]HKT87960.1 thymidine phosphorylase [Candidatus Sulfotelmatobacter sp.]
MRIVDLIRRKRDGHELTRDEIQFIVRGYTRGDFPDYQMSAWLMAVLLKGMSGAEIATLTEAMLHSGVMLDWSDLPGKKVDKHSTGGVGDKTSLILAPIVAAGGLLVPMISGRGLGHTGGTLDKLESIPGFNVNLAPDKMREVLRKCGMVLVGQTEQIVPADKKMYALRDVTGTVESPALICASIMSKKIAEGIDALVLDVKTGSGAFMKKESDAVHLAELMVDTGARMGKRIVALITDMDQPLGRYVGNALEVIECIEVLHGGGPADLRELSLELSAWMFYLGDKTATVDAGRKLGQQMIANGKAFEKFCDLTALQGGNANALRDTRKLPQTRNHRDVRSRGGGFVESINCEQVGIASLVLGGGREKKEDSIDPAVGIVLHKKVGDAIGPGEPICTLYYNSDARLGEAESLIHSAYRIGNEKAAAPVQLIQRVIEGKKI